MTATAPATTTVDVRVRYTPQAGSSALRVGVALTVLDPPMGEAITDRASATLHAGQTFPVQVMAFSGEPHPFRWIGEEVHSHHQRVRAPGLDVIAEAVDVMEFPRYMTRPLAGDEHWDERRPPGLYWGCGPDNPAEVCLVGPHDGWWIHYQAPSRGTFTITAPVARRRRDPITEEAVQLGTLDVLITIT